MPELYDVGIQDMYIGISGMNWLQQFFVNTLTHPDSPWPTTQQNSYSIRHLLGTVTTQKVDSDSVVTAVNWQALSDYIVDQLCSHCAAGSC